jgi:hypothetical protein
LGEGSLLRLGDLDNSGRDQHRDFSIAKSGVRLRAASGVEVFATLSNRSLEPCELEACRSMLDSFRDVEICAVEQRRRPQSSHN